jgi:hypothetical protein
VLQFGTELPSDSLHKEKGMAKVFVSYSRKNIEFAKRLTTELQKSDLDFWIDWEGIPPTVDWWKEIEKGIEETDVFLFLISPDSAKSKVCKQEIESAVKNGKRLIPVVVQETEAGVALSELEHLNYIYFRENDDFQTSLTKLLTAIHTDYDWIQVHSRLQVRALEWERNSKENSFLLRGKDLQDAEAQLNVNSQKEPYPTRLQLGYVAQSAKIQTEELEQKREKDQQIELEKKVGIRLRRLTYLLIGVFTVGFIVLFIWLSALVGNLAVHSVVDQMLAIAETAISFMDGDAYEYLLSSYEEGDEAVLGDEYYQWLASVVDRIVSANENIDGDVGVYFVAPARGENEVLAIYTDYDHFKSLWTVENDSVLLTGMNATSANTQPYTDTYGTWVSVCSPILNSDDISVGALCVDLDASLVEEARRKATNTLLIAFLAIYPAMIVIVFLTTRSLSRQRASGRAV